MRRFVASDQLPPEYGGTCAVPLGRMEEENIRLGLTNLMTFPWIAQPVKAGRIALHGMHFGIAEGRLARLDPETDAFVTVGTGAAALQA